MCFNTFIQHIKTDKYRQFVFSLQFLNPIRWFQFADDAAVISSQESENQHLLNRFSIWCQRSNMIIRVDKCSTFGIKKTLTKSIQYLPKLLINKQLIPKINIGEAFQYLGRYFSVNMSDEHHSELISLVEELIYGMQILIPNHYIQKIKFSSTVDIFCQNYPGILQFLAYRKRGSPKTLIPKSTVISVNGLIYLYLER